jgi:hypothetical protein
MGIRIHKAIGWGLLAQEFKENIGFEIEDDDLEETLWKKLESITSLVVPERSVSKIFAEWRGHILETDLLALDFSFKKPPKKLTNASELHHSISDYDDPTEVQLFLPSGLYTSLHRSDDTLDYVEETHDLTTGQFSEPSAYLLTELKQNPHPWSADFMTATGVPVQEPISRDVPRPPAELRWWLTETGILKEGAWKLLRPYYARWWA